MITVMRKHHKILMIFITVLVCISFSWYWNKTDFAQMGNGPVGRIYDRNVSQIEFQRNARLLRLGSQLGMRELITELTAGAQTEAQAFENFSWNLMVLRHEAERLGIRPDTSRDRQRRQSFARLSAANRIRPDALHRLYRSRARADGL